MLECDPKRPSEVDGTQPIRLFEHCDHDAHSRDSSEEAMSIARITIAFKRWAPISGVDPEPVRSVIVCGIRLPGFMALSS
jgi:hypothetical protein